MSDSKEKLIDQSKISRLEIINHAKNDLPIGRVMTLYKSTRDFDSIEVSLQDEGKTLKIFLDNEEL